MTNPDPSPFAFTRSFMPVMTRQRHDGWTPERQCEFIAALGESGCVTDACRRVGMSTEAAYALRRRYDAVDFRLAWDAALDYAVRRLSDAALSRAIHRVAVPHYYKGEVVGEHRRFDEGLTRFILRYRDPLTYAKSWDQAPVVRGHAEDFAKRLAVALTNIAADEYRERHSKVDAERIADADAEAGDVQARERASKAWKAKFAAATAEAAAAAAAATAARREAEKRAIEEEMALEAAEADDAGNSSDTDSAGEADAAAMLPDESRAGTGDDRVPDVTFRSDVASASSTSDPPQARDTPPEPSPGWRPPPWAVRIL